MSGKAVRETLAALGVMAGVLLIGCGDSPTEAPYPVLVSGDVMDGGAVVPHVPVALMQSGDVGYGDGHQVLDTDTTDASGHFTLTTTSETCPDWVVAFIDSTGYETRRSETLEGCRSSSAVIVSIDDFWPGPYPPF